MVQLSHPYMTAGKTIALTRWTFVSEVMSLLFNMLSRLVIAFLPRSKHLLISWLQSPSDFPYGSAGKESDDFGAQENKVSHCSNCFPICLLGNDGTGSHDLSFLNVEFYTSFFTPLFHFHQEVFSFSSLSAISLVSSGYLWLLIFLPAILIPACASSSLVFLVMYSAYKLNKKGDNIQP